MPAQKDLKRLVRRRMQKTGESYTAARSHILKKKSSNSAQPDYARLAGMSNDAVVAKTGCDWAKWTYVLDRWKAYEKPHREIAAHIHRSYDVTGWWAQTITVGYERIKGLREIGQRRGGGFDCNKSRTFSVPVGQLYRMFAEKRRREKWLPEDVTIRTSRRDQSIRMRWADDTPVDIHFVVKGPSKSTVTLQHRNLKSRAVMERMRKVWAERLTALQRML